MTRIFIGFIICFFLLNCGKKEENVEIKNKPYIISYEDQKLQKYIDSSNKTNRKIFLPFKSFYGESHLIIDKKGDLYYYQQKYTGIDCGTGRENDTLPHFLNLQPKDILKIPETILTDLLLENILNKAENRRILIIASQNDTIKNTSFFNFINKNKLRAYEIRRTTQEEDTVLKYKKNNESYYPDEIKWDRTKIKLPN
ncbi:hypothetical protein [Flavobacterium sp. N1736]|uniref:hypothetical protein n=1 Tax=Flavobacterium sp. N1736 TaxID=2986823 RepID=UPI0022248FF0|nr:hypothetical protein [Flavobacterium sp. N1736]